MVSEMGKSGKALNLLGKEIKFGFVHIKFDMSISRNVE